MSGSVFGRPKSNIIESNYSTIIDFATARKALQPSYIKKQLKPHQLMTIYKCLELETGIKVEDEYLHVLPLEKTQDGYVTPESKKEVSIKTKFGAICDPVGSGKTLTVLSLVKQDIKCDVVQEYKYSDQQFMCETTTKISINNIPESLENDKYTVIVLPHTLVSQWKTAIDRDTHLKCVEFKKNTSLDIQEQSDIIIVANTNHKEFYTKYSNIRFKRVFYDEADSIKVPNCRKLMANFYWFVTASFLSLHESYSYTDNRISCNGFIKNTFYKTNSKVLKHLIIRNDKDFIHRSFQLEDYVERKYKCMKNQLLSVLTDHVSDKVQQMICAGDIESAIATFGLTNASGENLVSIVCNDLYTQIENSKAKLQYVHNKTYSSNDAKLAAIERVEAEIKKIEESIKSISEKIKESELDPITYMDIENPVLTKCCKTTFDFESITMYVLSKANPLCPICRTAISKKELIMISDRSNDEEEKEEKEWKFESNKKIDNIKYLIDNLSAKARIIIFSEYDNTINTLLRELSNIEIKQIKGTGKSIDKTLSWFRDNTVMDKRILFMNSQYAGAGINLETGTDVFIYHSMSSELTKQVIGRCHRPGRTSVLMVHTFEEE